MLDFLQFSQNIDGLEKNFFFFFFFFFQINKSIKHKKPLNFFFIFTLYQNYGFNGSLPRTHPVTVTNFPQVPHIHHNGHELAMSYSISRKIIRGFYGKVLHDGLTTVYHPAARKRGKAFSFPLFFLLKGN